MIRMFQLRLAKNVLTGRIKGSPLVLCHSINSQCNLKCKFCKFWRMKKRKDELTLEEIKSLINQSAALGVSIYNVWAVEPLLRKDLVECLAFAKRRGMINFLITNGMLLENRIREIAPYLDYLVVSMDGIGKTYNELRVGGNFNKVLRGLKLASRYNFVTAINCVINRKNIAELEGLIDLAERYGDGILFEPVHEYENVSREIWEELGIRSFPEYKVAIDRLIELKKSGRKILNSFIYLKIIRNINARPRFKCHINQFLLHVDSDGTVEMCKGKIGNVRETPLREIWFSKEANRFREQAKKCRGCFFSSYVESSLFYDAHPSLISNYFGIFKRSLNRGF